MKFEEKIPNIEKTIGYVFRDKSLLRQAFTRTSYCNEKSKRGKEYQSNEVLEFFGDSVLSCAIITELLKKHTKRYAYGIKTKLSEGDFSNIKSRLSDKKNLSDSMKALGLQKFLLMGEGDAKLGIENEPSVMEDLFESIIGAVYIDCDGHFDAVLNVTSRMLDVSRYLTGEAPMQSYKNALQEWCADKAHRLTPPEYKTVSESGPDHKKIFERACYVGGKIVGVGIGKNQKIADSLAAESALATLKREYEEKKNPRLDPAVVMEKLRDIAKNSKKPSPEYRDLGETEKSNENKKEYSVECRFAGLATIGTGIGKRDAKENAAEKMLKLLSKSECKSEHAKTQRKYSPKKTVVNKTSQKQKKPK